MLSFTDWAIDRAEEVMLELGIADRCGFNKNGWMQLTLASPGATLPAPTKVCFIGVFYFGACNVIITLDASKISY